MEYIFDCENVLQIILGIFCPPYITKLEFKSKEELQLMPQTEEEHRYGGLDDENESVEEHSHDGQHRNTEADIEVRNRSSYQMQTQNVHIYHSSLFILTVI